MEQIILNIDNPLIETTLQSLSKTQKKPIETIIVNLLKQAVGITEKESDNDLEYKILDADKFITKINYNIDYKYNTLTSLPFNHVADSAEYIKSYRKSKWKR